MAAGFVTGQQKSNDRLKIRKRAMSGTLWPTCDNGGSWNHSLQRCDCPTGFVGKTGFSITYKNENC